MSTSKNALGKGLGALLENANTDVTSNHDILGNPTQVGMIANITLDLIEVNPFQPRITIDETALIELSESLKTHGFIQPVTVRKLGYNKFQLISGERRFRAAQLANLKNIPAFIRIANDQQMLEMAIVENLQRENLNPIEIAISFKRLIKECSFSPEELGQRVGKDRTTVTNYLRLLKLPAEIQIGIRDNKITMGHARALINIENAETQLYLYNEIIKKDLSVRNIESMVRNLDSSKSKLKSKTAMPVEYQNIQNHLTDFFATKVTLSPKTNGKGVIFIPFYSNDDLNRILELLEK